jgi:hypothetical protein
MPRLALDRYFSRTVSKNSCESASASVIVFGGAGAGAGGRSTIAGATTAGIDPVVVDRFTKCTSVDS